MDQFLLLRFAHLVGLMLMSAGLIGVFVADMRSRQVRDVKLFAQAVTFIAVFYDGLVVPGALLLLASGTWLIARITEVGNSSMLLGWSVWWSCSPHRRQHYYPAIFHEIAALGTSGGRDRGEGPQNWPKRVQSSLRRSRTSSTSQSCW